MLTMSVLAVRPVDCKSNRTVEQTEGRMLSLLVGRLYLAARSAREEKGQTMAEYAVVLAVITLGIVVAMIALAGGIGNALNGVRARLP